MKTRYVAIALAATLGLGSVSAFAQGRQHDNRAWQHQRADRGNWGHGYNAPRYYAPSYGRRHDNGDVVGAVVLGALAGALVGQAANSYNYAPPAAYYSPPSTYYAPPATYYGQPPAAYYNPGYGYGYYGP